MIVARIAHGGAPQTARSAASQYQQACMAILRQRVAPPRGVAGSGISRGVQHVAAAKSVYINSNAAYGNNGMLMASALEAGGDEERRKMT